MQSEKRKKIIKSKIKMESEESEVLSLTFKDNKNTTNVFHINNFIKSPNAKAKKSSMLSASANVSKKLRSRELPKYGKPGQLLNDRIYKAVSKKGKRERIANLDSILNNYSRGKSLKNSLRNSHKRSGKH